MDLTLQTLTSSLLPIVTVVSPWNDFFNLNHKSKWVIWVILEVDTLTICFLFSCFSLVLSAQLQNKMLVIHSHLYMTYVLYYMCHILFTLHICHLMLLSEDGGDGGGCQASDCRLCFNSVNMTPLDICPGDNLSAAFVATKLGCLNKTLGYLLLCLWWSKQKFEAKT